MLMDLVIKTRSFRRFFEDFAIDVSTLRGLVDLTRYAASSANLQPLRFFISCESKKNSLIFPHIRWAGYLKDWPGPPVGERPSAYIIILGDTERARAFGYDTGIAAQTIMLGAVESGLGGCMISSIDRDALRKALSIPSRYEILVVIALGKPKERVVLEAVGPDGDVKYWRDKDGVHHVPKRGLEDILIDLPPGASE